MAVLGEGCAVPSMIVTFRRPKTGARGGFKDERTAEWFP
jgi:hypothetical protein